MGSWSHKLEPKQYPMAAAEGEVVPNSSGPLELLAAVWGCLGFRVSGSGFRV